MNHVSALEPRERCRSRSVVLSALLLLGFLHAEAAAAPPQLLEWIPLETRPDGSPVPLRDGSLVRFDTRWDQDSLNISADFSEIAPGDPGSVSVVDLGAGSYRISHLLPARILERDARDLPVRLLAVSTEGDTTREDRVRYCVSNDPPAIERVTLLGPPADGYGAGTDVSMRVTGRSDDDLKLFLFADVRAIDPSAPPNSIAGVHLGRDPESGADSFLVRFTIPASPARVDTLEVPIHVFDTGCGSAEDRSLALVVDTEPPATPPTVDPLPAKADSDSVVVRGSTSPGVPRVVVRRQIDVPAASAEFFLETNPLDSGFTGTVPLVRGRVQSFAVASVDAAGNRGPYSVKQFVRQSAIAPVLLSWTLLDTLSNGAPRPVRHGDTVRILTRWNQSDLNLAADFFSIAPNDAGITKIENLTGGFYRLVHALPDSIERRDAANLPVSLTAVSAEGVTTQDTSVRLCVSNHPPVFQRVTLLGAPAGGYGAGTVVSVRVTGESGDDLALSVFADVRAIDPSASPNSVVGIHLGRNVTSGADSFLVRYTIPATPALVDTLEVPIRVFDAGCGSVEDRSLRIAVDSEPPAAAPTVDPLPAEVDPDSLFVTGSVLEGVRRVVVRRTIEQPAATAEFLLDVNPEDHRFAGSVPLIRGRVQQLSFGAVDAAGNRGPFTPEHTVRQLDSAPVLVSFALLDTLPNGAPRAVRNGDTVRILTHWDQSDLNLTADFFSIAPNDAGVTAIENLGGGLYRLVHALPDPIERRDGANLPVVLTAVSAEGVTTVENSVRLCLSNHPPRFVRSAIVDAQEYGYRGGDSLYVRTAWETTRDLALLATADFRALEPTLGEEEIQGVLERSDTTGVDAVVHTFLLRYRIPLLPENRGQDGTYALPTACVDDGCGRSIDYSIRILLDTTSPDTIPTFDTLPSETDADSILIRGTVDSQTLRVALLRNDVVQRRVPVDTTHRRFEAWLVLDPNKENKITAWGEDPVGNRTRSSASQFVFQVRQAALTFEQPFVRGGAIEVRDPGGANDLEVRLFDLEGSCLELWRAPGSQLEHHVSWDGVDRGGNRARQGLYLLRASWRNTSGRRRELTRQLLLRD